MDKFRNKYRIKSTRLENWDYRNDAAYFVTLCTENGVCFFGEIIEENSANVFVNKMNASEIGKLAEKFWHEIPEHFPFVKLDAFIVMPNHIHGIIIIDRGDNVETPNLGVSTQNVKNWAPGSLGVIINQYKRIVTINARKINPDFSWQSRFYDHIIRNEKSLYKIRNYIVNNPQKWNNDKMNPNKIGWLTNGYSATKKKRRTVTL